MQNAVVFLVEDEELLIDALCQLLLRRGHQVVLKAANLEEALQIVASNDLRERGVSIAIVDGSFPDDGEQERAHFNGPKVVKAIRDTGLPIKIIAHTAHKREMATYGDIYAPKQNSPASLFEAIAFL